VSDRLVIQGAREHNLRDVSLELPRDRLIVFTGISGSGKSSLAFDTIYAEGQRRYVESLSAYARQFLGQMDKPDVDFIEGLSPAISIDQKSASRNPRSTVGTITEVYDYLRLLFARVGVPHDPETGEPLVRQTPQQIVDRVLRLPAGTRFQVLAPVVRGRKGTYETLLAELEAEGYVRARVDGELYELADVAGTDADGRPRLDLARYEMHDIEVVVDRLVAREGIERRLTDSVEAALRLADGVVQIEVVKLGGEVATIRFRCQAHCVSPRHGPRSRKIHVRHGLVDHGGNGEDGRVPVGMRSSVQDILYLVAKQGECHWSICKEVRKSAAFAEMLRPVGTLLEPRKFRAEGDEARPPVAAVLVEQIRQLLQCGDLRRRRITGDQTTDVGEAGGCSFGRATGIPGGDPIPDLFDSHGLAGCGAVCDKQRIDALDAIESLIRLDAGPERRLAAGKRGAQRIPAANLLLHVPKMTVPPILPSTGSAHAGLVRRLTRRTCPLLHAEIGPLRCGLQPTRRRRHQVNKRAVRELHPILVSDSNIRSVVTLRPASIAPDARDEERLRRECHENVGLSHKRGGRRG